MRCLPCVVLYLERGHEREYGDRLHSVDQAWIDANEFKNSQAALI